MSRSSLHDRNVRLILLSFPPSSVAAWMWETVLPLYIRHLGVSMVGVGTILTSD